MIDAFEEEANNVFVDGPGPEKSMVNGALTALGTFGAVGAVVSDISVQSVRFGRWAHLYV